MPRSLTIPTAIVLAGVFIGGAVFFSNKATRPAAVVENVSGSEPLPEHQGAAPVPSDAHMLGDPEAPIIIIEYSERSKIHLVWIIILSKRKMMSRIKPIVLASVMF